MYFDSFESLLQMDGHGGFVWAAYAITSLVIALLLLLPRRRQRQTLRRLQGELRRQQGTPTAEEVT
jgi:heme exporter protein D